MKVILIKSVPRMGSVGDIVDVKEGYAKNYLLPQRLAVSQNDAAGQRVMAERNKALKIREKEADTIRAKLNEIGSSELQFSMKTNAKGQLFASINQEDIKKVVVSKYGIKPVAVEGVPIKNIGAHKVIISFGGSNQASLVVNITKKID